MSHSHFDLIENYDAEIPLYMREYLASRKTAFMLEEFKKIFGEKPLKILDAGCGTGWHLKILAEKGHDVSGIDNAEKQVAWANTKRPPYSVTKGDILAIPYKADTFDVSYTINTLHHLSSFEAQKAALRELARVTRQEGLVIVHEMNTRNPLIRLYLDYIFPKLRSIDDGSEQWIRPSIWEQIEGFELHKMAYFTFVPDFTPQFLFPIFRAVESVLERSPLETWSAHYMVVLRNRKRCC